MSDGLFAFINKVPNLFGSWHGGENDHTDSDANGYMYLIAINKSDSELFNMTINDLFIEQIYRFSAYLANAEKNKPNSVKPNVRFEVRTTTTDRQVIAQFNTSDIPQHQRLTWQQYGISFKASNSSLVLLIISNVENPGGNDLIIDDIELELLSMTNMSGDCISG